MRKRGPKGKYPILLSEGQRTYLKQFVRSGPARARETQRARILLACDESQGTEDSVAEIASAFDVSTGTVRALKCRFVEEGLDAALHDKPRPGQPEKLSGLQKAKIIALTCSTPPEGHEKWSIRFLTEQVIELGISDEIGRETIRTLLKKTRQSRG
jgi:transposase